MDSPTQVAGLRSQITTLQTELDLLRARYDTLLEANTRLSERYKADYKKWRGFKQWLFQDAETDETVKAFLKSGELHAYKRASALGKRKQLEEPGSDLEHIAGDGETKAHKQESVCEVKVDLRSIPATPRASRNQRRKSYHGESSRNPLSSSATSNEDPFLPPLSANLDDNLSSKIDINLAESSLPPIPEPRKGRGRYAQFPSGIDTINSRFSIRKDRNDGLDHQYEAVVRNREERKHMLGGDCECCREYYDAVGPLPASRQPLWRSPRKCKASYKLHTSDDDKENTDEVQEHKQLISRHRHHWHRPKTPPGYWDIGFPDTQEVLDINRRAAEMHQRKLIQVEVEAKNSNGRYVKRAPRTP